jgi:hypothetical protein
MLSGREKSPVVSGGCGGGRSPEEWSRVTDAKPEVSLNRSSNRRQVRQVRQVSPCRCLDPSPVGRDYGTDRGAIRQQYQARPGDNRKQQPAKPRPQQLLPAVTPSRLPLFLFLFSFFPFHLRLPRLGHLPGLSFLACPHSTTDVVAGFGLDKCTLSNRY